MAGSSIRSDSSYYVRAGTNHNRVRTYNWPPVLLNIWILVMLLASTSIVGVFATFIQIQQQLQLPIPW